jgi:polyisoprenoid-binding protein YceI
MRLSPALALALTFASLGCPTPSRTDDGASVGPTTSADPKHVEPAVQEDPDEGDTGEPAPRAEPLPGQEVLAVDREHSEVGFAVARATIGHIGHFARFTATLTLDDGQPHDLEIVVRTGSVAADQPGLTEHLKSADFFDVDKFPTATFTAHGIEPMSDEDAHTHRVRGTMQLHGVDRELDFPATFEIGPQQVTGSADLDISASAFGIDYEGMAAELAEDRVRLEIELVFPRVAAPRG